MDEIQGFRQDEASRSPTFYAETPTNSVSREQIEALKVVASKGGGVARLCLHSSPDAAMHIMVIAQTSGRYWRPKKHVTKIKSFTVVEGRMAVIQFTELGVAEGLTVLQPKTRSLMLIAPSTIHTNLALTPMCVHIETIQGPFVRGELDRVSAQFAPDEVDDEFGKLFILQALEDLSRKGISV